MKVVKNTTIKLPVNVVRDVGPMLRCTICGAVRYNPHPMRWHLYKTHNLNFTPEAFKMGLEGWESDGGWTNVEGIVLRHGRGD